MAFAKQLAAAETQGVMRIGQFVIASVLLFGTASVLAAEDSRFAMLRPQDLLKNAGEAAWMVDNVPLFECSDRDLQETYYFRWHVYRRHIKPTPDGYVITEFL